MNRLVSKLVILTLLIAGVSMIAPVWAHPGIDIAAANWKFTPDTITLHAGETTQLRLTSTEGVHGIKSAELGIPLTTLMPGNFVTVSVTPKKAGVYVLNCAILCGPGHEKMSLTVKVEAKVVAPSPTASQDATSAESPMPAASPVPANGNMSSSPNMHNPSNMGNPANMDNPSAMHTKMMHMSKSAADTAMMSAMMHMHASMTSMQLSGDPDKDFMTMMIPHHQSAIDMANAELKYGKNPKVRALAKSIIAAQQMEIREMRAWLR